MTDSPCHFLLDAFRRVGESSPFRLLSGVPKTSIASIAGNDKENQDRLAVVDYIADDQSRSFRLFAVADGVGGLSSGGECAEVALTSLTQKMIVSDSRDIGVRLGDAFRFANHQVFLAYKGHGATTLSVLAISGTGRLIIVSVGDSRVYRYSASSSPSNLEQLTEDDTIGNQVALAKGERPSRTSPGGVLGQLTQAVGSGPEVLPAISAVRHADGDEYLLTSDGFHSVGRNNILKVLGSSSRPLQAIERLAHMARWLGTKDDISSIMIGSIAGINEAAKDSVPAGGLLRIHTLHGTFVFSGIHTLMAATMESAKTSGTASGKPDFRNRKAKRRSGKKRAGAKNLKRNRAKSDKSHKSHSTNAENGAETEDSPPQQELEINYVGKDQD